MSIDFFEDQDKARRITGSLVFYFILGMLGVTVVLCLLISLLVFVALALIPPLWDSWIIQNPWHFLAVLSACIILFILLCTRWRISNLRKRGGRAIAEMLGGRLLQAGTESALERRLMHVVDEMAIAAGISVPLVYVLHNEPGINAFVAGYEPHYAVLGVTRGTLKNLNRGELQGVIGHEFSHILNGDMRLNLQLIGWLYGITLIGQSGKWLLYTSVGIDKESETFGEESRAFIPGVVLGTVLMTVGSLGTFFGDIIKASVCRQREYLADASSVEFTRNPAGLSGALKKIGGFASGTELQNPNAAIASHMFFGQGILPLFRQLLATHPPLDERIKRIDPAWPGTFQDVNWTLRQQIATRAVLEQPGISFLSDPEIVGNALPAAAVSGLSRTLEQSYVAYRHRLLSGMPQELFHGARLGASAPVLVYALLLTVQGQARHNCEELLSQRCDVRTLDLVREFASLLERSGPCVRLPLLDVAIPQLCNMEAKQYEYFQETVHALIRVDKKMSLSEWVLWNVLQYQLGRERNEHTEEAHDEQSLSASKHACSVLLAALATFGERDKAMSKRMFERAAEVLHMVLPEQWRTQVSLQQVAEAIDSLVDLKAKSKKRLLAACIVCVCENNEVSVAEGELLRAIAVRVNCPAPPLLPGQPLV